MSRLSEQKKRRLLISDIPTRSGIPHNIYMRIYLSKDPFATAVELGVIDADKTNVLIMEALKHDLIDKRTIRILKETL